MTEFVTRDEYESDKERLEQSLGKIRGAQLEQTSLLETLARRMDVSDRRIEATNIKLDKMGTLANATHRELLRLEGTYQGLNTRLDDVELKLTEHDTRFEAIDQRFDSMDRRFDGIDAVLQEILQRLPAEA
jgi:chromosome segregation ATPase